ncbi:MAG: enoyl-CoA hydratase/isomerase family protein [Gemmatimonadetes bacterium]|nr:enoyl-CoA hydratase/isomerase family protein [Gemmatimonadota bacterium]MBI2615576.1 enoyl-CoA hydratase/isomerase family protein [Gemmatimonadota bacterium]
MAEGTVLKQVAGRVATVTINRPEKRNALDAATRAAIVATLDELERDPGVRAVIVTGAGDKAFIAGADIAEFEGRAPVDQFRVMSQWSVYQAADRFPKPIIAAINGFCLGGGCEFAMACDIRIAADTAKLGQPEINLGIIPGGGGTQRLPRLVGLGNAFKLLYTGDLIDAAEALRIGLVDEVVPAAELMARAQALAEKIATKSPVALSLMKEAVRASVRAPLDEGLRQEATLFGLAFSSQDKREGVAAFLAKRTPEFTGR